MHLSLYSGCLLSQAPASQSQSQLGWKYSNSLRIYLTQQWDHIYRCLSLGRRQELSLTLRNSWELKGAIQWMRVRHHCLLPNLKAASPGFICWSSWHSCIETEAILSENNLADEKSATKAWLFSQQWWQQPCTPSRMRCRLGAAWTERVSESRQDWA